LLAVSLIATTVPASSEAAQAPANARLDKHLKELSRQKQGGTVDVIVMLDEGEQLASSLSKYACSRHLAIINGFALCNLPVTQLEAVASVYGVYRIHHNRPTRGSDVLSSAAVSADVLVRETGYSGAGVTVALVDSGLTRDVHPDFGDARVLKSIDFVKSGNNAQQQRSDFHGHGTHVAGIVGGTGAIDPRYAGIAPGTNVVSLRVLDDTGKGSIGDIISALDWIAHNYVQYNIRVVNLSVGAGVYESYWIDPLTLATKALVDRGITVVAAAGNFGKNAKGELQWGGITAPGVAPWVLTVCAFSTMGTLDPADDEVAAFSSSGPTAIDFTAKPDVCAPGVGVVSLAAPESELYRKGSNASPSWLIGSDPHYPHAPYMSLTGTSQAAPVVTGTVALMLQANPNLTPNLIKAILQYTARSKPGISPLRQGAGFINAAGAVALARFYASPEPGASLPIDPSWSQHIIWGNHLLSGGVLDPGANAWMPGVEWGWAYTQGKTGEFVVWGSGCDEDCENIVWGVGDDEENIVWGVGDDEEDIVWGVGDDEENIVWGVSEDDENIVWGVGDDEENIVWGIADDEENIVWGVDCGGRDCVNVIWGAADDDENIVWGVADDEENIVWGVGDDEENIVWGVGDDEENIVWGVADDEENIVWGITFRENVVWPIYLIVLRGSHE
jgi:subtilisin family serine protease